MSNTSQTGFTSVSAKFDTTGLENPFYETSSKGDSLIEQMKNNILLVNEVKIEITETEEQNQKEEENTVPNRIGGPATKT